MSIQSISPADLRRVGVAGADFDLIDVRTPGEYAHVHAEGAINLPLDSFSSEAVGAVRRFPDQPLYVICRSDGRSTAACQKLLSGGIAPVVNVAGGTLEWERAGLPVVRGGAGAGKKWVRGVATVLALCLLVLGFTVSPYFGIVGAVVWFGLVAAGGCPLGACSLPQSHSKSSAPD